MTMAPLREVAELAAAFVPSRERQLETSSQGRAFIEIARSAWNCDGLDQLVAQCDGAIVYPVAVGLVSAAHDIPLAPTMHAFFHAVTSNWISAGARLIPLGQTDSQRVLAQLEPVVVATAKRALQASLDDLGSATFPRRSRQPAARDAVHAAVPVMSGRLASIDRRPANAGTHTPRPLVGATRAETFFTTTPPVAMGPCVRRDDKRKNT